MSVAVALIAALLLAPVAHARWSRTPEYGIRYEIKETRFSLPASAVRDDIADVLDTYMAQLIEECVLVQLWKRNNATKNERKCRRKLPRKAKLRIIPDYAFRCDVVNNKNDTGLCRGQFGGGQWISYFRRAEGTQPPADAMLVRSPEDMQAVSGGKNYWTKTYSEETRFWVLDDNFYDIFAWEVCHRSSRRRC